MTAQVHIWVDVWLKRHCQAPRGRVSPHRFPAPAPCCLETASLLRSCLDFLVAMTGPVGFAGTFGWNLNMECIPGVLVSEIQVKLSL